MALILRYLLLRAETMVVTAEERGRWRKGTRST